jgi:hypothetical protein
MEREICIEPGPKRLIAFKDAMMSSVVNMITSLAGSFVTII